MDFDPNTHLMQIKNKNGSSDYLPVQWRLVWFRSLCPDGTIETEMVHLDLDRDTQEEGYVWNADTKRSEKIVKQAKGIAIFRAVIKDGKGGVATGTKCEKAASFPDYVEKSETGSIGRALAALGYGTQFVGEEFNELPDRIVDAPVERKLAPAPPAETHIPLGAPLPSQLRERHKFLKMDNDWETVKMKMFKRDIPDDHLTPEQCIAISGVLERFYQQKAKEA